ncbi:B12-binding domain-containing radical SAM protein [Geomesophilobacter sediminis]|uniref:Radical SAM protein n=1 Tax=Geomesophilobacter sediminis TaxID=2798584 RepID=A0A8J7LYP2_9BACT|nr:radical SAM protein [Geomesophilobacter sediminis]MBJ6725197.1 radical SAM protein [Geomesophilobacter sediminis]
MKVLLISANTETANMVPLPLGLNCVAVATRNAGHDVRLLDLMGSESNKTALRDEIETFQPRVIGISVRNIDNQNMAQTRFLLEPVRETVARCRSCSAATIVIGGAGFSIFPEATLEYLGADLGICGEGEAAFTALLQALQEGADLSGIPGLCRPGKPVVQESAVRRGLDELPLPDPALWSIPDEASADIWIPYQTRRGCPMRCSYCSTPTLEGTAIRKRSVEAVVAGIARHVAAGFDRFYFVDNTFNLPPDYAKELCDALAGAALGIRWRCILYPGSVDEEVVRKMAQAGCVEVSLGFESGCPEMLRTLNKHYDREEVRFAAALLKQYGIRRMGFLLLGGPGETRESVRQSLDFAESLDLDLLKLSMGIRIYPGTALERAAREEGMLEAGDDLLLPRFYFARGADEWLIPMVQEWMASRPYCTT